MADDDELPKLKAELAFYKGFHDGVCKTGTHVVVPVEPTEAMSRAGANVIRDTFKAENQWKRGQAIYRAMIKAAQEGDG